VRHFPKLVDGALQDRPIAVHLTIVTKAQKKRRDYALKTQKLYAQKTKMRLGRYFIKSLHP